MNMACLFDTRITANEYENWTINKILLKLMWNVQLYFEKKHVRLEQGALLEWFRIPEACSLIFKKKSSQIEGLCIYRVFKKSYN